MDGSDKWDRKNVILYSTLSGCNFIPRFVRLQTKDIEALMREWKDPNNKESLEEFLIALSNAKHWPSGNNKPGNLAIDFYQKYRYAWA